MTRAVFLGSPPAAVPALATAMGVTDVVKVITQPDKPAGRSGKPAPTAIKVAAEDWGLDVVQPTADELAAILEEIRPDVGIVVAYGRILRSRSLESATHGFVNLHFSLLPAWRGAAPVQAAIASGDAMTGVTLMRMDAGLDTGPVIDFVPEPIRADDTGGTLTGRLSSVAAALLKARLPEWVNGDVAETDQDHELATSAPRLSRDDARLSPGVAAEQLERAVRAYSPRPGAWLGTEEGRVKVHRADYVDVPAEPGVIESIDGSVVMGTPHGSLALGVVQPAGKRPMEAVAWMNGRRDRSLRVT